VRKDFAERYPEVVVAYIKALVDANDWVRQNPRVAAEKVEAWTKIEREVVYMFLGPNGIHTLDPTIKPAWIDALKVNYGVLRKMKRIGELEFSGWVNDKYARQAHAELGLDYEQRLRSLAGDAIRGHDPICKVPIEVPERAGEIWVKGGEIVPFSSTACTFLGVHSFAAEGKKLGAVYVIDSVLGIKLFADAAFYVLRKNRGQQRAELIPFLLKGDAERAAREKGGKVVTYAEALSAARSDVQQG
jgi:NitT/TauT family transport system substrate-binding protein